MLIPGYTQTKSKKRFPYGDGMPEYITSAAGSKVYDENGKKYVDWTASLGTIIRGYGYFSNKYVDGHRSLPMKTKSEDVLADLLHRIIPIADSVRFFKNGSDACTAAVRLAQKVTGRNRVFSYGYHGWHDWATINNNDLWDIQETDSDRLIILLSQYKPACFILEPVSRKYPVYEKDILLKIKEVCSDKGIILIFDEILWGFRTSIEGVGIEIMPDLACYGKAMSNGCPLSALVGRSHIMDRFDETGVTGTYFSDDYSFEAAIDTIGWLQQQDYISFNLEALNIKQKLSASIVDQNLQDVVSVKGFGPWWALDWYDKIAQHVFIQEIIKSGHLFNRDFFLMFSHSTEDKESLINACTDVLKLIKNNYTCLRSLITTKLRMEL